jgi:hypothetical protein
LAVDGFLFGGGTADFVVVKDPDTGELVLGADTPVWFYNAQSGGTRYTTGLTDPSGDTAILEVTSDSDGGIPQLRGLTDVPYMWADASGGAGPRRLMVAVDLGDYIVDLRSTIADLQAAVTQFNTSIGAVRYNYDTSSWPDRPADSRIYIWFGPSAPSAIPDGDYWINPNPAG